MVVSKLRAPSIRQIPTTNIYGLSDTPYRADRTSLGQQVELIVLSAMITERLYTLPAPYQERDSRQCNLTVTSKGTQSRSITGTGLSRMIKTGEHQLCHIQIILDLYSHCKTAINSLTDEISQHAEYQHKP